MFLGSPASGKGTQAARFAREHGFVHFDMGGALRREVERGSALADRIRSCTDAGRLVPMEIIRTLVLQAFTEAGEGDVLLDGFPRSLEQAQLLDEVLRGLGRALTAVVVIELPEALAVERTVNRRVCPVCGRAYNLLTLPPRNDEKCDDDGTPLEQRRDDTDEVVRERLRVYHEETQPIIEYYQAAGVLARVSGSDSIEAVGTKIEQAVFGV